MLINQINTLSF